MERAELLVLTGLCTAGVDATAGRIRMLDPDAAVVHHDLSALHRGVVRRRVCRGDLDVTTTVRLATGRLPGLLRQDLLPQLLALARPGGPRRIVLHLDPTVALEQICWALLHMIVDGARVGGAVDLLGVVTCIDADRWLDDATGTERLREPGSAVPGGRSRAQLAVVQAESADLLVHTGGAVLPRTDAVLARLAPAAERVLLADLDERVFLAELPVTARRGRPGDVHGPLLRGQPPLDPSCGVQMLVFEDRRPFHPERLHAVLDVLLHGVVRTRGRIWLATRPDAVLWLESAGGGLHVGHVGNWLAESGPAAWEQASAERRALASLGCHARFGDRSQDLVVITHDADPEAIATRLRGALLSDAELAGGAASWRGLPDPFGWWHEDPCDTQVEQLTGHADAEADER